MNNNQLLTSCFSLIKCWVTAGQQVCGECCSAPCLLPSFHRHWWNFFISWISDLHYVMDENEPFLTSIIAKQGCGICTSSKAENASLFFLNFWIKSLIMCLKSKHCPSTVCVLVLWINETQVFYCWSFTSNWEEMGNDCAGDWLDLCLTKKRCG